MRGGRRTDVDGLPPHFDEGFHAHTLDGRTLTDGAELELQLADQHWARVLYYRKEYTTRGTTLTLMLAYDWEASMDFNMAMRLRWPEKAAEAGAT